MIRRSRGSSLDTGEEEKVPSYESVRSADDKKVQGYREKVQDIAYEGTRPVNLGVKNVILFGETGVGKSSVINLMAGREVAKTSSNLEGCTLAAAEYTFSFPGVASIRIFDTVGLEEPDMGVNTFMGAIVKAHELVSSLNRAGGVDLLLFCVRGGRITTAMQRTYQLFFEVLCGGQVPLAIVVTNLEQEEVMEDWWGRNEETFRKYDICSVAHACITAVPGRITMYAQKRAESQQALRTMLLDTLGSPNSSYVQETRNWFVAVVNLLRSFLTKKGPPSLRKKEKDLFRMLETECKLTRSEAQKLAQRIVRGTAAAA